MFAPKIYYLHPLLAGPREGWPRHLARCREIGCDHLLTAPLFAPGATADIFLAADHERVHPAIAASQPIDDFVRDLVAACRELELELLLHVGLGRVAADADVARSSPSWFHTGAAAKLKLDPRIPLQSSQAAYARFDEPAIAQELAAWWIERLRRLADVGVAGFVCQDPQLVPPAVWRDLIGSIQQAAPACRFLAWTPGLSWQDVARLRGVGFAAAFSSVAWWDGRAEWLVEEHELLRGIGAVIGSPELPFGPRLARRFPASADTTILYRHMLRRAAATGSGLMIPMGFELAAADDMDRCRGTFADLAAHDTARTRAIADELRQANALSDRLATLRLGGEMRALTGPGQTVTGLLRSDAGDVRSARHSTIVLINSDLQREQSVPIPLDPLPRTAGAPLVVAQDAVSADGRDAGSLAAGEVRLLATQRTAPIKLRRNDAKPVRTAAARIVIENIVPAVDGGAFAAKSIIGEPVGVEADVFTDGHDVLAVDVLWRAADENAWRRGPMQALGNDRWRGTIVPERIGRHELTLEAWRDRYGTFCRELEIKHAAGMDVHLEIAEARELLGDARARSKNGEDKIINAALNGLTGVAGDAGLDILLKPGLRHVMRNIEEPQLRRRSEPTLAVDVERPQAAFGAWYELFPRSASRTPGRHGTLEDVISRLPAIRDMGFDVLYLPPIHPIGVANRKGRNNALRAEPGDVGSPYAIGGRQGGHDAIDPALGTIEDFRQLRDAASAHGLELALDFAIQCSPDHPWLKEHPEWFNWRPDGSLRYAENPPKKYEDIVNVDFYADDALPGLWNAWRDVLLHWIGEDVRIFRVDNPHTKPLPFWEWLIAQVRARHPDVIFLSEAFTRPKMMYRLAKAGFSQSYTYFTWRNTKQELTDYFVELTTSNVKDYFRPHLFVNTPDINPYFLQTSGRPGFLIRAALAATLSGLWGMYSGFELCESAPLPGREEYLDSEKYEIRSRDYDSPGNISAEIAKLNRIRRANPALQSHLGLRFYRAHNDRVIFYGKSLPGRTDIILVAISLDPFDAQDATIEVPLWELNLPDDARASVRDLVRDHDLVWHGKLQRIRLDPRDLPYAIWRIAPHAGG